MMDELAMVDGIFFGVMTKRKRVPFAGQGTVGSIAGGFSLGIRYQGPPGVLTEASYCLMYWEQLDDHSARRKQSKSFTGMWRAVEGPVERRGT